MTPAETARNYDALADRWQSDTFPAGYGIAAHERAIGFAKERRHALDVGCGASGRIIELFRRHGFEAEGLDLSERMLELARLRHPQVVFHRADICEWRLPRQYDVISAWDSLWHVPLARQAEVLAKLLRGLAPGGVCIFTTAGADAPIEKVDAGMGAQMYYAALGIARTLAVIDEAQCVCRHLEYDQYPELHLCVIAQRR